MKMHPILFATPNLNAFFTNNKKPFHAAGQNDFEVKAT